MKRHGFLLLISVLFSAILLSGCYESQDLLLDDNAPRQPFKAGDRTLTDEEGEISHFHLTPRADGWYDVVRAEDGADGTPHKVLLNDLGKDGGRTLYTYATYDHDEEAYVYGVLAVEADGRTLKKDSDCHRDADTRFAVQNGGKKMVDSCQFLRNANGLVAALKALADNPKHWTSFD